MVIFTSIIAFLTESNIHATYFFLLPENLAQNRILDIKIKLKGKYNALHSKQGVILDL